MGPKSRPLFDHSQKISIRKCRRSRPTTQRGPGSPSSSKAQPRPRRVADSDFEAWSGLAQDTHECVETSSLGLLETRVSPTFQNSTKFQRNFLALSGSSARRRPTRDRSTRFRTPCHEPRPLKIPWRFEHAWRLLKGSGRWSVFWKATVTAQVRWNDRSFKSGTGNETELRVSRTKTRTQ